MTENKNDGSFSTSDKKTIDALRAHPLNKANQPTTLIVDEVELDKMINNFRYIPMEELSLELEVTSFEYSQWLIRERKCLVQSQSDVQQAFVSGYKAAQDKGYSIEDLKNAFESARDIEADCISPEYTFDNFEQYLNTIKK